MATLASLQRGISPEYDSLDGEDAPSCWICLEGNGELIFPCKCPRIAHVRCLARWQLQSAGSRRETHCEFCDSCLPSWKHALTPAVEVAAPAVMNVNFDGRTYSFEVSPGPDGYKQFTAAIRRAFNLPEDSELNITFTCDEPLPESDSLLTLQGAGAYDAAVHCASVSAARRLLTGREGEGGVETDPGAGPGGAQGSGSLAQADEGLADAFGVPKRRLGALGRRLRSALNELLTTRT